MATSTLTKLRDGDAMTVDQYDNADPSDSKA